MSTTTIERQESVQWKLPDRLTEHDVESWLTSLGGRLPQGVTIKVGGWRHTALFGDVRLFGAINWLRSHEVTPALEIPPTSLLEGATTGESRTRTPSENRLDGTVGGLASSLLCELDDLHRWWKNRLERQLDETNGYFGIGQERSFVERTRLPTSVNSKHAEDRFKQGRSLLFHRLQRLAEDLRLAWIGRHPEVKTFVLQAWENACEHGSTTEHGYPIDSLRFLSIRRTDLESLKGLHDRTAESGLHRYVERMRERAEGTAGERRTRLMEVTVADGGIGIPARMARTSNIYTEVYEQELGLFKRAMQPGGSSKARGEPGWGLGYRKMLRAAFHLNGIVVIRSGRVTVAKTYVGSEVAADDFTNADSAVFALEATDGGSPLIGGTAVSLFFPLDQSAQPPLF
jgi:hypothetical protein